MWQCHLTKIRVTPHPILQYATKKLLVCLCSVLRLSCQDEFDVVQLRLDFPSPKFDNFALTNVAAEIKMRFIQKYDFFGEIVVLQILKSI